MAHTIASLSPRPSDETLLVYDSHSERPTATVEIVVPVYNEEAGLEPSIRRLHAYPTEHFPLSWTITIADNASTDRTWPIACRLALLFDGVRSVHLAEKGRVSGHSDLAIGTRLAPTALVARGPKREAISRTYDLTAPLT